MLTEPLEFHDALATLGKKLPIGSKRKSKEWAAEESAVKERAFFSSRVESVRFLQRARRFLTDYLKAARTELQNGEIALAADSRARFVRDLGTWAIMEGLGPVGIPPHKVNHKGITDIRSEARLKLVFDTQTRQAVGYGYWKQGMSPEVRAEYPAARFVRRPGAIEKRPRHAAHEGDVRLKSDFAYWSSYQNAAEIGGFENPYPPYGFHSRMDQVDVDKDEARELGLVDDPDPQQMKLPGFNDGLKASLAGLDPDLRKRLRNELGAEPQGDEIRP